MVGRVEAFILEELAARPEMRGADLRALLTAAGRVLSRADFYLIMERLEGLGLVERFEVQEYARAGLVVLPAFRARRSVTADFGACI